MSESRTVNKSYWILKSGDYYFKLFGSFYNLMEHFHEEIQTNLIRKHAFKFPDLPTARGLQMILNSLDNREWQVIRVEEAVSITVEEEFVLERF